MHKMAALDPPDFITFLFSEKPTFDCYFIVGKKDLVEPERIGAVKMMLMAHSVVFRTELEDSELKEKNDITVKDIYPDAFRTLLKYVYGFDTTGDLGFDEADNLFYAAEKYMMSNLKNKLAVRLMALLTPNNVLSLLGNPACSTHLQLNAHINQIFRYETDKVLASPQFLEVSPEVFITILEQDGLAVPEIELWRAAIKWAKHREGAEEREAVRTQMNKVSKHLRICTLSCDQFCQEVIPTEVLSIDELALVCQSIGEKRKVDNLKAFCNEIEPRKTLHKRVRLIRKQRCVPHIEQAKREIHALYHFTKVLIPYYSSHFVTIVTEEYAVELLALVLKAEDRGELDPVGWKYKFKCTIEITNVISKSAVDDTPLIITFSEEVEYENEFEVPLVLDGCNVALPPNSKFTIKITVLEGNLQAYKCLEKKVPVYNNDHMRLGVGSTSILTTLYYTPVDDK